MTRITNYTLGTLLALLVGMFISAFSFGEYTMVEMLTDVTVIVWCVAFTDCIYNILKSVLNPDEED